MNVECIVLGEYQTNCYIVRREQAGKDCLVIDTGLDGETLIRYLQENGLNPTDVILTHGHIDHIYGLRGLESNYPEIKVHIHKLDADMLTDADMNMSALTAGAFAVKPADELLEDNDTVKAAGMDFRVIHTPGHTAGGICLYCENYHTLFSGDTLFADSVGRTDLPPYGSMEQLIKSIKEKLLILPDETKVYPGHGPETTIGREKAYNQYLQ